MWGWDLDFALVRWVGLHDRYDVRSGMSRGVGTPQSKAGVPGRVVVVVVGSR